MCEDNNSEWPLPRTGLVTRSLSFDENSSEESLLLSQGVSEERKDFWETHLTMLVPRQPMDKYFSFLL